MQPIATGIWSEKYQLRDAQGEAIDTCVDDTYKRVAQTLANQEKDPSAWYDKFLDAMRSGATPAGRIMSNAGAEKHKPRVALINCTVADRIEDSMEGIMASVTLGAAALKAGCGIGYNFSTLRPKGAEVAGAGAHTSGPLPFMNIFDQMCLTIRSAGDRRGAQMGTLDIWHPDVVEFIKAKRKDGVLRNFNLSVMVNDEFMQALAMGSKWQFYFPIKERGNPLPGDHIWKVMPNYLGKGYTEAFGQVACKVYAEMPASEVWDVLMQSNFDYAEPGVLFIDNITKMNNLKWCEIISSTNPCGEQPLPPMGSCLLGSIDLTKLYRSESNSFDMEKLIEVVQVFTRMLDNVVEIANLPVEGFTNELLLKRRHGMGITGYGTLLNKLGLRYGGPAANVLLGDIMKIIAVEGYRTGVELAKEKGSCPLLVATEAREKFVKTPYMDMLCWITPGLETDILKYGCRFTHHSSIAPTGTISMGFGNNCSSGIEPTFAHRYPRNFVDTDSAVKRQEYAYSAEFWDHCQLNGLNPDTAPIPESFGCTDDVTIAEHLSTMQTAQHFVDSAISKTVNVKHDITFEDFKRVYIDAHRAELKGCTTFRPNPKGQQGVMVKPEELAKQRYKFTLADGKVVEVAGNEAIKYKGSIVIAANLFEALKEGKI